MAATQPTISELGDDPLVATFHVNEPLPRRKCYDPQKQARAFWRLSDAAGHTYPEGKDARGKPVLPQHEREEGTDYQRRLLISKVRRYVRSIIDRYNDHVCRQPASRPDPAGGYKQLLLDTDGSGTPLDVTMRRALRSAQIDGVSYLLADTSKSMEQQLLTRAQEEQAGVRPFIIRIRADEVIWWRDWRGELIEGLVLMVDTTGKPFAWYVTDTFCQRIDYTLVGADLRVTSVGPEIPHTFKGCPLVRLMPVFGDETEVGEDSQAGPIAESQKRIFHLDSLLMEELENCTFTTYMISGISKEQLGKVTMGSKRILCIPQAGARADKLGSDVAQADSLRKTMMDEIAELYRIAGLSPGNPLETGAPESGVAKAFAFNEVEAKLSALGDAAEGAENKAVKRALAGVGESYPGDATWPDSFESPDLAAELDYLIRVLMSPVPDTIKREQLRRFISQGYKLDKDTQAQVNAEVEAYETPPATAMPAESSTETIQDTGA